MPTVRSTMRPRARWMSVSATTPAHSALRINDHWSATGRLISGKHPGRDGSVDAHWSGVAGVSVIHQ